jgi:hypothetical protein
MATKNEIQDEQLEQSAEIETVETIGGNFRTLNTDECLEIDRVPWTRNYGYKKGLVEGSPMEGKFFYQYTFDDKVFIVHQDHKFNKDFDNDDLYSVKLKIEDDQFSFVSHISESRYNAKHKNKMFRQALNVDAIRAAIIANPEMLVS